MIPVTSKYTQDKYCGSLLQVAKDIFLNITVPLQLYQILYPGFLNIDEALT